MNPQSAFVYGQARLQARHGARLQAAQWQVLDSSRTAGQYLTLARAGALAAWVEGLDAADDAHRIERHFRSRWQQHVEALARWQPVAWQPALRWFGRLTGLALAETPAAPQVPTALALATARLAAERWLAEWQRRLPPQGAGAAQRPLLLQVARWLLPRLCDPQGARSAAALPARVGLLRLFRRHPASAVAVCAQLALDALDLERLRGGLVQRLLFEAPLEAEVA